MSGTYLRKSDKIMDENGHPTNLFLDLYNQLIDQVGGQGRDIVAETQTTTNGIVDGTKAITPTVDGVGDLTAVLTALNENVETAASSTGGTSLMATASPASLYGQYTGVSCTITPTGGTGPYTVVWTKTSAANSVAIDSTTTMTPTFTQAITDPEQSAVYQAVVTDAVSDTYNVSVPVYLFGSFSL